MIGEIIFFISAAWALCILLSLVIIIYDEDAKADNRVIFLFPANLIFIIKYWWKTIVKAIKSYVMEWKIGEIKQINGEWYQCVREQSGEKCIGCSFKFSPICIFFHCLESERKDHTKVIFKKLEKVGEPKIRNGKMTQKLRKTEADGCMGCCFWGGENCAIGYDARYPPEPQPEPCYANEIYVVIKQNKEDMEENKTPLPKEDNALTRTVYAYVNGKISDKELIRSIKEMSDEYPYDKNGLKPFSLELAKQGKPVCTRDGRKARIICWDIEYIDNPIAAAVFMGECETVYLYTDKGEYNKGKEDELDLMMLPEKEEGWVNVYKGGLLDTKSYNTKKEAFDKASPEDYVDTVKIEWTE